MKGAHFDHPGTWYVDRGIHVEPPDGVYATHRNILKPPLQVEFQADFQQLLVINAEGSGNILLHCA